MPNEPLAPDALLAGLPDQADYQAAFAALMASEPGRRFLVEVTSRNRSAETTIVVVTAVARAEAAIRGGAMPASAPRSGDLSEVAAALDRIQARLAAHEGRRSDVATAIERIQDIAFVLHERPVEQTLCDTLDAAIRAIADALAPPAPQTRDQGELAGLVAALASRVRAMIAPTAAQGDDAPQAAQPRAALATAVGEATNAFGADGDLAMPPPERVFDFAVAEDEAFVETVEILAASAPRGAGAAGEALGAETDAGDAASAATTGGDNAEQQLLATAEVQSDDESAAESDAAASTDNQRADEAVPSSPGVMLSSEDILNQALALNGHFARAEPFGGPRSGAQSGGGAPSAEAVLRPEPSGASLPSVEGLAEPVAKGLVEAGVSPQNDADDLFEPPPAPAPPTGPLPVPDREAPLAPPPASTPTRAAAVAPPPTPQTPQPPTIAAIAAVPMPRAAPRPPASDPLAAVRALSEEEVIALFS